MNVLGADSEQVDIAFGFDLAYAPHVAAVLASIVRHAPDARLRLLMLTDGLPDDVKVKLQAVAPEAAMLWIDIADADLPQLADRGHISRATLFRLGLERFAPADCHRLIYLDADLIVLRDIRDLWRTDLNSQPLAAAIDSYIDGVELVREGRAGAYFNAGVLLLDMDMVRTEKLLSKALAFQIEHGAALPFSDQDALNWAFWGRWQRLDNNWNVQRHMLISAENIADDRALTPTPPGIVHFTCADKPWLRDIWHPWAGVYWENLARTPFLGEVARREGVSALRRFRMRLRWLRRRPASAQAA